MAEAGNEELTADEVETLRLELERRITELDEQLASNAEAAKPVQLDQTAVGRVSRVDALQGQALAKATRHAMQQQLAQCKAALQAVARDEYGLCRSCEEPIGFRRLQARPESPLCLACQRGKEQR